MRILLTGREGYIRCRRGLGLGGHEMVGLDADLLAACDFAEVL
jgi:hypothetical protein